MFEAHLYSSHCNSALNQPILNNRTVLHTCHMFSVDSIKDDYQEHAYLKGKGLVVDVTCAPAESFS